MPFVIPAQSANAPNPTFMADAAQFAQASKHLSKNVQPQQIAQIQSMPINLAAMYSNPYSVPLVFDPVRIGMVPSNMHAVGFHPM